jgi:hypothetical protein
MQGVCGNPCTSQVIAAQEALQLAHIQLPPTRSSSARPVRFMSAQQLTQALPDKTKHATLASKPAESVENAASDAASQPRD